MGGQVKVGSEEAAALFKFCSESFPRDAALERYCYDRCCTVPPLHRLSHMRAPSTAFNPPNL